MRTDDRRVALGLYRTHLTPSLLDAAHAAGIRHLDCAYNYGDFGSIYTLGQLRAGERFAISSKVGYFPGRAGTEHSLSPSRLVDAAEQTAHALGGPVDTLFLHNPEQSLAVEPSPANEALHAACGTMRKLVDDGYAHSWGIATWDAGRLIDALDVPVPMPDAVMVRVGLSLTGSALRACHALFAALAPTSFARWGMSPLGGARADQVLAAADFTGFVDAECSNAQAALRLAFELPQVSTVCVSTSSPTHLRDAVDALRLQLDEEALARYRSLVKG